MPANGPCIFHSDVFVLTVPTKHVGLVMGKGKSKFFSCARLCLGAHQNKTNTAHERKFVIS